MRLYADMDVRWCLSVHEFSRGTLLCVLYSRSGDSGLQCLLRIEGKSPSLCIQITLAAVAVKRREIKQLPKQHTHRAMHKATKEAVGSSAVQAQ